MASLTTLSERWARADLPTPPARLQSTATGCVVPSGLPPPAWPTVASHRAHKTILKVRREEPHPRVAKVDCRQMPVGFDKCAPVQEAFLPSRGKCTRNRKCDYLVRFERFAQVFDRPYVYVEVGNVSCWLLEARRRVYNSWPSTHLPFPICSSRARSARFYMPASGEPLPVLRCYASACYQRTWARPRRARIFGRRTLSFGCERRWRERARVALRTVLASTA